MMNFRRGSVLLAPLIVLLGSPMILADTVTVNVVNPLGPGLGAVYGDALSYSFNNGPSQSLYYAGAFQTNVVNNGATSLTFDSYCIDLYHDFNGPISQWTATTSTTWNVGGNTDPANPGQPAIGGALAYLVNTFDPAVANPATDPATAKIDAAALQIALWSVEYNGIVPTDSTANLAPGRFFFGTGNPSAHDIQSIVYTIANADIASINGQSESANFFKSNRDVPFSQDLIGPGSVDIHPLALVPEPNSIALIAIGLGLVAFRARRRA